jgi:uroporphyrinogen decarboxylase
MRQGGFEFDGVMLSDDLGYSNGPFFSPRHYEQQLHPVHRELFGYFRAQGLPVILHADGDVKQLIPFFIAEGVTCLNPIETKAGMDLVELKQEYGDLLALFGGIDVRAMADPNPSVVEEEIRRKVPVAMKGGGYIFYSDGGGVGHDVSFEQYKRVIELVLKYGAY